DERRGDRGEPRPAYQPASRQVTHERILSPPEAPPSAPFWPETTVNAHDLRVSTMETLVNRFCRR
ncbi:MAG TPA: hypothetical protein VFY90_04475, partial [Tepidiformaceae bacterium]|nr:hypothetical protein [Tepidiformaceae bacterium]